MKRFIQGILAIILFIGVEIYTVFIVAIPFQKIQIHIWTWIVPSWFTTILVVLASGAIIYFTAHLVYKLLEAVFGKRK